MIRILIVEDEQELVDTVVTAASARNLTLDVVHVSSRDEALVLLDGTNYFDLLIVDLNIPSVPGALDADPDFGREVYAALRFDMPGTLLWVFSAYADDDFVDAIIEEARQGDPFASGTSRPMIRRFRKIHLDRLISALEALYPHIVAVNDVEVSTSGIDLDISSEEKRLLRIFSRKSGGTTIGLKATQPGLSGSRTFRATVIDKFGGEVANCVVKLGSRVDLEEEARRYEDSVPQSLTATCFAPMSAVLGDGAPRMMGLVFSLAAPDARSLAEVLGTNEQASLDVVSLLRDAEKPWHAGGHTEQLTVEQACELLSAPDIRNLDLGFADSDIDQLCNQRVQVRKSPQHGDLHLENVLVSSGGVPILIDYGRTGPRIASYDPVTLELCLAFHPAGRSLIGSWPTVEQAQHFDKIDSYVDDCPYPNYVKACRSWAHEVANGNREVWLAVLGLALRQLQYPDVTLELPMAYARCAVQLLLASN